MRNQTTGVKEKDLVLFPGKTKLALAGKSKQTEAERVATITKLQRLVHELQVHQVELQAQNEELRRSTTETHEARRLYADLYDFAPIAYFTLDASGIIIQSNLTAAALLGISRQRLL